MWDFLLGLFPTVVYNKGPDEQHTEYWWQKKKKNMNQSKVTKYDKAGNYQ